MQTIERALRILDTVATRCSDVVTVKVIAQATGLHPATCVRMLKALVACGYLEQEGRREGYRLGPKVFALTQNTRVTDDLTAIVRPHVSALAKRLEETIVFAVFVDGRRLSLAEEHGDQAVQVRRDIAQRYNPYASITGRLLLAFLPEDDLQQFVDRHGLPGEVWPEATCMETLTSLLEEIRHAGFAIRHRENGVSSAAFPVAMGAALPAAIGTFLPTFRFQTAHGEYVLSELQAGARLLSDILLKKTEV